MTNSNIIKLDQITKLRSAKRELKKYCHYLNKLNCRELTNESKSMIKDITRKGTSQNTIIQARAIINELTSRLYQPYKSLMKLRK